MLTPLLKLFLKTFVGINTVISEDKDFIFLSGLFQKVIQMCSCKSHDFFTPKSDWLFYKIHKFFTFIDNEETRTNGFNLSNLYPMSIIFTVSKKKKCADSISNAMKRLFLNLVISKRNHLTFKNYFSIYCLP